MAKLTGERPMAGSTPDSLLALHDAGYREVAARLGPGTVLDIGCGVGRADGRARRARSRTSSASTTARRPLSRPGAHARDSPGLQFAGMDGAALAIRDAAVDTVVSSHIIEHFVNPVLHVAELARVLRPRRQRLRHHTERAGRLREPVPRLPVRTRAARLHAAAAVRGRRVPRASKATMCSRRTSPDAEPVARGSSVSIPSASAIASRDARYVWSYERALPAVYRLLGSETTGIGSGIDASHLFVTNHIRPTTPVLFAIARGPRSPR